MGDAHGKLQEASASRQERCEMANMTHGGAHSHRMLAGSFLAACLVLWFGNESAGDGGINPWSRGMGTLPDQSTVSTPLEREMPLEFERLFSGRVDNRFRINMELTRRGKKLRGYILGSQRADFGSWVKAHVQGEIDRGGNVSAKVTTDKPIGTLRGKLSMEVTAERRTLRFSGELTRPVGGGVLSMESTDWLIPGRDLSLVTAREYGENPRQNYVADIYYPQIQPVDGPAVREFNGRMQSRWNNELHSDIRLLEEPPEVDRSSEDDDRLPPVEWPSFLHVNWSPGIVQSDFVSIKFYVTSLGRGAVHSVGGYSTVNYDLRTANMIDLSDLFLPDSDYLKVISDYCFAKLAARKVGNEKWRKEGAGPSESNFRTWLVVPWGLRILFSPYQVASFSEGAQEVVVPFSVFERLLKPERRCLFLH